MTTITLEVPDELLADVTQVRCFAALPPDVRRWLCLAERVFSQNPGGYASGGGIAARKWGQPDGKAQPFRTSGGTAASVRNMSY